MRLGSEMELGLGLRESVLPVLPGGQSTASGDGWFYYLRRSWPGTIDGLWHRPVEYKLFYRKPSDTATLTESSQQWEGGHRVCEAAPEPELSYPLFFPLQPLKAFVQF